MSELMKNEEMMRQGFRYMNKFMVLMWRLGMGKMINFSPEQMGRIMVITHTGRKSGLARRTPVNYALIDGELYCTVGFGEKSDWYRNILKTPEVEVWLPGAWWAGRAEDVSDIPERLQYLRQVLINSGFAASTFSGLDPHTISDEDLVAKTEEYRLIRIRKTSERAGPNGPGDLAYFWPLAGLLVLAVVLLCRLVRKK